MANDGGIIAKLEQWLADNLAAITYDEKPVFKTSAVWRHQVAATSSGMEAFERYEPFAFVAYTGADAAREGDYDLRQVLSFSVLIGVESKHAGVARTGDDNNPGISRIRDMVIAAVDRQRPDDETVTCDEFYYVGETEVLDSPRRHAIEMRFEVGQLTVQS